MTTKLKTIVHEIKELSLPEQMELTLRLCGHASALSGRTKRKLLPNFYGGHVC